MKYKTILILICFFQFCNVHLKEKLKPQNKKCESIEKENKEVLSYSYSIKVINIEVDMPEGEKPDFRQILLCTGNFKDVFKGKKEVGTHLEFNLTQKNNFGEFFIATMISFFTLFLVPSKAEREFEFIMKLYKQGQLVELEKSKIIFIENYWIGNFNFSFIDYSNLRTKAIENSINEAVIKFNTGKK